MSTNVPPVQLSVEDLRDDVVAELVAKGWKRVVAVAAVANSNEINFAAMYLDAVKRLRGSNGASTDDAAPAKDECPRCHKPRHRGKCKGVGLNPALRAQTQPAEPVMLQQIEEEFHGKPVFTSWYGIDVRYPTLNEVQSRCRPGPKDGFALAIVKLSEESPTGCTEFKLIAGITLQSYASRIGGQLRKHSRLKFSVYQDRKTKTIIVKRRITAAAAAAAGAQR